MSGLETLGIVASLIQIADAGANLSVRLFTFCRQVKAVNKSIQNISSDVSLTSTIMRQLAENLRRDEQGEERLCSSEAFQTAQEMLNQCLYVFEEVETTIKPPEPKPESEGSGRWRLKSAAERARNALLEPDFNALIGNLERLKSNMLLLLNVIMYAGQIRSKSEKASLHEQRQLIEQLLDERKPDQHASTQPMCPDLPVLPAMTKSFVTKGPNGNSDEIGEYKSLVKRLLSEVDAGRFILEHSRYTRIKDGVLNIHSGEVMRFRLSHGCSTGTFDDSLFESELSEAETESYEKFPDAARSKQALAVSASSYQTNPTKLAQPTAYNDADEATLMTMCLPPDEKPTHTVDNNATRASTYVNHEGDSDSDAEAAAGLAMMVNEAQEERSLDRPQRESNASFVAGELELHLYSDVCAGTLYYGDEFDYTQGEYTDAVAGQDKRPPSSGIFRPVSNSSSNSRENLSDAYNYTPASAHRPVPRPQDDLDDLDDFFHRMDRYYGDEQDEQLEQQEDSELSGEMGEWFFWGGEVSPGMEPLPPPVESANKEYTQQYLQDANGSVLPTSPFQVSRGVSLGNRPTEPRMDPPIRSKTDSILESKADSLVLKWSTLEREEVTLALSGPTRE